jgi:hypothetical protein
MAFRWSLIVFTFFIARVIMNVRFAIVAALALTASLSASGNRVYAQNPNFPGYLGVYVVEGNGGMRITGFIRNTPAEQLAMDDGIFRNETIVRLAGRPTRTLSELKYARNTIPLDQEAKMVLRTPNGGYHYVWIGRSEPSVASPGPGGTYGSAAPGAGAPDEFSEGGEGQGGNQDFRPKGGNPEGGSFGSPAPGSAPAPRGNSSSNDDGGDFRPKKN